MSTGGSKNRGSPGQDRESAAAALRETGCAEPGGLLDALDAVRRELPSTSPLFARWDETWREVLAAPDPELALTTWLRWVEDAATAGGEASEAESRAAAWKASREFRAGWIRLAGTSPALGNLLLRHWNEFRPQDWKQGWVTRSVLERRIGAAAESMGEKDFMEFARAFHHVQLLRIAYLDVVEDMPVDQVTRQISILADALIAACYEHVLKRAAGRRGFPAPRRGFAVLALGKLGGQELNYSSDVDLNFIYDDAFVPQGDEGNKRLSDPSDTERFFTRVAERLVQVVTAFTESGRLFRLDARLRPGGSCSRLVWSARSSVDYYYTTGRAWERQALIRMRPIAGDLSLARRFLDDLDAFIFPRAFTAEQIAEVRGLKRQVERIAADRGPSEVQIKIGRGGIRDVEYIVQYLQLVHASSIPALKTANTFQALEILDATGILQPEETDVLRRGYRFLRRVEHRIQLAHLRQTHRLPDDPAERLRLARGLGFPRTERFLGRLGKHASGIRRVYALRFEEATTERSEEEDLPSLLELPLEVSAKDGAPLLVPFGFSDAEKAFRRLHELASPAEGHMRLGSTRSRDAFSSTLGPLLHELSLQPEPDRALANLADCAQALGAKSVFFQMLAEQPGILQLFVEISARTTIVVETLKAHPDVFDEVVDCLLTGYTFCRQSLFDEIQRRMESGVDLEKELFHFKHLHLILIAIRDLMAMENLQGTLSNIAALCEAVLHALVSRSLQDSLERFGNWAGEPPRFLVLGLGKLGGREMSYKSDLDLVLIHAGDGVTERGVSAQEFFERMTQSLLQACGVSDSLGPLLRIDLRLRPLGSHNSLSISLEAWKQYFSGGGAATWERQAFLRARALVGDEGLADEVTRFIREEMVLGGAAGPPSESVILADVAKMREKIERNARPGDIKRGEGGIIDVEFLVQALQLCHGRDKPDVVDPNTPVAIQALMRAGIITGADGDGLLSSYEFLRKFENRLSLLGEAGQSLDSLPRAELASVVQKLGYKSSGEESPLSIFQAEMKYYRQYNRWRFRQVLRLDRPEPGSPRGG